MKRLRTFYILGLFIGFLGSLTVEVSAHQFNNQILLPESHFLNQIKMAQRKQLDGLSAPAIDFYKFNAFKPGDSLNVRRLGRWGYGYCHAVTLANDLVFSGNGGYLQVLNFSNPVEPVEVGKILLPSIVEDIVVRDNYAYVANFQGGLQIIDVTDPELPRAVGALETESPALALALQENYILLAVGEMGLQIIDISQPANPIKIGECRACSPAYNITVSNNYAYLACASEGLKIIDISNPASPELIGALPIPEKYITGISVQHSFVYLAAGNGGLRIIEVTDPSKPSEVGAFVLDDWAWDVAINDIFAFVAFGSAGFHIFDVADPKNIKQVSFLESLDYPVTLALGQKYAYVSDEETGLRIIDITNPDNPQNLGGFDTPDEVLDLALCENHLFVASQVDGLRVIDITNPMTPEEIGALDDEGLVERVAVSGDYAYITTGYQGLRIVDVTNPAKPVNVAEVTDFESPISLFVREPHVFVADLNTGLYIIDISKPGNPNVIGKFSVPAGRLNDVKVSENYAYLAVGIDGLKIIDITEPNNPQLVGMADTDGTALAVAVHENYVFIADGEAGLQALDVSNLAEPLIVATYNPEYYSIDVLANEDYVGLIDYYRGLRIVDRADINNLHEVAYYETGGFPHAAVVNGNTCYLADGPTGIYILEILLKKSTAPSLLSPANGSIFNNNKPVLVWEVPGEPVDTPLHFLVELAVLPNFEVPPSGGPGGSPFKSDENSRGFEPTPPLLTGSGECSYTLEQPLPDEHYFWRVTAKIQESFQQPSPGFEFVVDTHSPFTSDHKPANQAINVPVNTNIELHLQDGLSGVEKSSVLMNVNGTVVQPVISGTVNDFHLLYDPANDFEFNQLVNVVIQAHDLAGNVMPPDSFLFRTELGDAIPVLTFEPTELHFGNVTVNDSAGKPIIFHNPGQAPLQIHLLDFNPIGGFHFTVLSENKTLIVNPNSSINIAIRYSPRWSGRHLDFLRLQSNDPLKPAVNIKLEGTGIPPRVESLSKPGTLPAGTEQTGYRLLSVPLALTASSVEAVLFDDLGNYDIKKWRLFEYRNGQYLEYPTAARFAPGRAFWLITKNSATIDCGAGALISDRFYKIPLQPGWNPIATPYNQPIPTSNLQLASGSTLQLWYYSGFWNDKVNQLMTWEGYGLLNDSAKPDTLLIAPNFLSKNNLLKNIQPSVSEQKELANSIKAANSEESLEWWIEIKSLCGTAKDCRNLLAVSNQARSGWDELDRGEPPPVGEYVAVYFDHPEWKRVIRHYSRDCRPQFSTGENWEFEVATNIASTPVELTFNGLETVPSHYQIVLLNQLSATTFDLRETNSIQFYTAAEKKQSRKFNILVGTANYILEQSAGFDAAPTSYHLTALFPNPFNAGTQFVLSLPENNRVQVAVYDILGRQTATLMHRSPLEAGRHLIKWNGHDQTGTSVSSGIYLIVLQTDKGFRGVRKALIVK